MSENNARIKLQSKSASHTAMFESLESRLLASGSFLRVGAEIQPAILSGTPSYFRASLPAGTYIIEVAGGSMTYAISRAPLRYQVNEYKSGDFGFKVVEPGFPRFDAPGLSVPRKTSAGAEADSTGTYIKFVHKRAGKIGIELYDNPYADNRPGSDGSPEFILKEYFAVPPPTASAPAVATAMARPTSSPFSTAPIMNSTINLNSTKDKLDSLT